jgi:hypothetical protein
VAETLTPELASRFAHIALSHVEREYPHKLDHVMSSDADVRPPRELHPIFFGSFDWHSCVHGYWTLARLFRRFPELPEGGAIAPSSNGGSRPPPWRRRSPSFAVRRVAASSGPTAGPGC